MENILALGKLLRLWFCFLLHSILFFISQTSYRTYKIISSYELARPIMGTIFLVTNISRINGRTCTAPEVENLKRSFPSGYAYETRACEVGAIQNAHFTVALGGFLGGRACDLVAQETFLIEGCFGRI